MFRRLRWPKMSIRPYGRFSQIRHGWSWRSLKDRACEPVERGEGYASRVGLNVATGDGLLQGLHLHANRRQQRDATFERPGALAYDNQARGALVWDGHRSRRSQAPDRVAVAITTGPTSVV